MPSFTPRPEVQEPEKPMCEGRGELRWLGSRSQPSKGHMPFSFPPVLELVGGPPCRRGKGIETSLSVDHPEVPTDTLENNIQPSLWASLKVHSWDSTSAIPMSPSNLCCKNPMLHGESICRCLG